MQNKIKQPAMEILIQEINLAQKNLYRGLQSLKGRLPYSGNKKAKIWLTADEHYHHKNIIKYQNRPFSSVEEMDKALICQHNNLVKPEDWTIHIGDFLFGSKEQFVAVVTQLNGYHAFLDGSHDYGLQEYFQNLEENANIKAVLLPKLFEFKYNQRKIVLCHYAMTKWWASHYDSLHFHGHSHGKLAAGKNFRDVGVDTTNFNPILIDDAIASLDDAKMEEMEKQSENPE